MRIKLLNLIKSILDFNGLDANEQQQNVHFFGPHESGHFRFSLDEKWIMKKIVNHVKTIVDTPQINGGLAHFVQSEALETGAIPFFNCSKQIPTSSNAQLTKKSEESNTPLLLQELIASFEKNSLHEKHGYRYSSNVKEVSAYLRLVSGPLCYDTLQKNLQSALPSLSSVNRYIRKQDGIVEEAVLRSHDLLKYLNENNVPLVVSLSEDATRNDARIQYRSATNEITGFVPPINSKTGMPIPHSYPARNFREIISYFKPLRPISHNITVVMAQPMANIPAFCLLAFGSDSKYTTEDIIKRWKNITEELQEINIAVINIASDSDPKFNSAMRKNSLLGMESNIFGNARWFCSGVQIISEGMVFHAQDTPHILSKLINRFLKSDKTADIYPFGKKFFIRVRHLKELMKKIPKDQHQLTQSDLDRTDRQNIPSALRLCSFEVIKLLRSEIPESEGTAMYLEIMRNIFDSFMKKTLQPLERVQMIWYSVFLLRIWRSYVSSQQLLKLNTNFLSQNCYACAEINAHNMVLLLIYLKQINKPHLFQPWHLTSQPCESFFRSLRSYSPVYSTVVSCSIKEMLERIQKIQLQSDIGQSSNFEFPRVRRAYGDKSVNETIVYELPTRESIFEQIEQCKKEALSYAVKIGLMSRSDSKKCELECKLHAISLKQQKIPFVDEHKDEVEDEEEDNAITSTIDFRNINLQNFADQFVGKDIPENSSYVRIDRANGKDLVLKKTSLCWLLRPDYRKLSSDRLIRVKSSSK